MPSLLVARGTVRSAPELADDIQHIQAGTEDRPDTLSEDDAAGADEATEDQA